MPTMRPAVPPQRLLPTADKLSMSLRVAPPMMPPYLVPAPWAASGTEDRVRRTSSRLPTRDMAFSLEFEYPRCDIAGIAVLDQMVGLRRKRRTGDRSRAGNEVTGR